MKIETAEKEKIQSPNIDAISIFFNFNFSEKAIPKNREIEQKRNIYTFNEARTANRCKKQTTYIARIAHFFIRINICMRSSLKICAAHKQFFVYENFVNIHVNG